VWSFPTLEPTIVEHGSFVVERLLERAGRVEVGVGDIVTPDAIVARSAKADKTITLYVASELGVPNDKIQRQLTKPVGSQFAAGEVVAHRRHGMRSSSLKAPMAGTLGAIDETAGTVQLTVSSESGELRALVHGDVDRVIPDRGALIRASGSRVFGILGFGPEAVGRIAVGLDRPDRELTADQVKDSWRGALVLTGMTVGVPAMQRLQQAGVAGIVVGSLAEADVRRMLSLGADAAQVGAAAFWSPGHTRAPFVTRGAQAPFAIVVTEGFGRIPMADPVFSFLRQHESAVASVLPTTAVGEGLSRPEIYLTGGTDNAQDDGRANDELFAGRTVRVTGGALGSIGTLAAEPYERVSHDGARELVAVVQRGSEELLVPAANLEVLI
jgi:hypothetical protein